jgi:hypothetical protein
MPRSTLFCALGHCFRIVASVLLDLARLPVLATRSRRALVAENLFLRKQLALFQERKTRPRRPHDFWVAIVPSAGNVLTFKAVEENNRQRCLAFCCA